MKKIQSLLLLVFCTLFINAHVFSQAARSIKSYSPFSKGTWNFANKANITYTNYKVKAFPSGTSSGFDININPKYFFTDHIAVGIEARASSSKASEMSSTYSSYGAYLNLTYGTAINKTINIYGTIGAGPAHSRSSFNSSSIPGNNTVLVSKSFDINATIGVPVLIQKNNFSWFTPYIRYDHFKTNAAAHIIHENTIAVALKLETYFDCHPGKMKAKNKMNFSKNNYNEGSSFLEFNSMSNLSFTTRKETQGNITFGDVHVSGGRLETGYHYYFMNNLAGGINVGYISQTTNNGPSKTKNSNWYIQPMVMANLPAESAAHNLFLQAGYGFGGNNSSGIKKSVSNISVRAGYNFFFAKNLSITPRIGYEHDKLVTKGGSSAGRVETKSGLAAELGIRTWLDAFWKLKKSK